MVARASYMRLVEGSSPSPTTKKERKMNMKLIEHMFNELIEKDKRKNITIN